jgi:hypothetical protein
MRSFNTYEKYKREREEWHVRGRLQLSFVGGRLKPLEEILARAQLVEEDKRRLVMRAILDDHEYELRAYTRGGLFRRSRPLDQLNFATQAVGAGLDVSPIDAACVAGGHVVIFQESPKDWIDPASYLTSSKVRSESKRTFLASIARYCRRLHDAGFYQPHFSLSTLRARIFSSRLEFRVHDIDGAQVRPVDDDDRFEMLGRAWQKTPLHLRQAMRFLRSYLRDGEDSRKVALTIWHYYGRQVRKRMAKRESAPGQAKFVLGPYDVHYVTRSRNAGTDPEEIEKLYRAGLKGEDVRIVRSPDALTLWKRTLRESEDGEEHPMACFVKKGQAAGFVVYREQEPS